MDRQIAFSILMVIACGIGAWLSIKRRHKEDTTWLIVTLTVASLMACQWLLMTAFLLVDGGVGPKEGWFREIVLMGIAPSLLFLGFSLMRRFLSRSQ